MGVAEGLQSKPSSVLLWLDPFSAYLGVSPTEISEVYSLTSTA